MIELQRKLFLVISLPAGIIVGVFFHYLLYRLTLPVEPFIYVAF
jgi:hypothetical protein